MPKYEANMIYVHESGRRQRIQFRHLLAAAREVTDVISTNRITAHSVLDPEAIRARQLVALALRRRCLSRDGYPLTWKECGKILNCSPEQVLEYAEALVAIANPRSPDYDPEAVEQWKSLHVCVGAYDPSIGINAEEIGIYVGAKGDPPFPTTPYNPANGWTPEENYEPI